MTTATTNAAAPALKEWAAIVHALLEGEQIVDVRKGGLTRGRPPLRRARAPLLALTHRRAPTARAAEAGVRALDRPRRPRRPSASRSPSLGWADVVDVATITEPEHLDALDSKLIWTDDYVESRFKWKQRDPLWVLVLRVHRLDEPLTVAWSDEYGGCTSWVDYDGLPADPATVPSEVVLSDVAFEAKRKGIREALPEECWKPS